MICEVASKICVRCVEESGFGPVGLESSGGRPTTAEGCLPEGPCGKRDASGRDCFLYVSSGYPVFIYVGWDGF